MNALSRDTLARIDGLWGSIFGPVDRTPSQSSELSTELSAGQITGHLHALHDYSGIYAVVRDGRLLISAPDDLVASLRTWAPDQIEAMHPQWWTERLPGWSVLGPSVHAFADSPAPTEPSTESTGLRIRPADPGLLADLRARVGADEWTESGFASSPEPAWAVIDADGQVVGAASLSEVAGLKVDIGVLTASDARGNGVGTAIAGYALESALQAHGIARWRALESNLASRALAARLGFVEDCRQIAVRPPAG